MNGKAIILGVLALLLLTVSSCRPDGPCDGVYDCTEYVFEDIPKFPEVEVPADNPLTISKLALGRELFYETSLSLSGNTSCATCHKLSNGFSDNIPLSTNDLGDINSRNASPLVNLAYLNRGIFWDGRSLTIEEAVLDAIVVEQHLDWDVSITSLKQDDYYRNLFARAFEDGAITEDHIVKAIASFLRTVRSSDAKIDLFFRGEYELTAVEQFGLDSIFNTEKGDCFHCHGVYPFMTDNDFHNNALQENVNSIDDFGDPGRGAITEQSFDYGKMKTPSLRNLSFTAPYMHDGRFSTLDEVIDFYSSGLHVSPNVDPLMKKINEGGLQLTPTEKDALKAFLLTFDDPVFVNNPAYDKP